MNVTECAKVLAKIQLVDNREVTDLVVLDWLDYIGDLDFRAAIAAVVKFRRECPGVYLEPGHVRELAGAAVVDEFADIPDIQQQLEAESRARVLAAAGVTEAEYVAHELDVVWVRERIAPHLPKDQPRGFEIEEAK